MNRFSKFALCSGVFTAFIVLASTGCGSSGTKVRLLNAMDGQSSVNLLLDNNTVASGVSFGTASGYSSSSSGSHSLQVQSAGNTLLNVSISLNSGNNTVLATDFGATVFADNKSTPSSGNIQIRVINASSVMGTVDVYIVAPNTDLSTVNPSITTLAFQEASDYQTLAAGSYQIEFTQSGSKNVIVSTTSTSFSAGQIRTVVSLDGSGGGFTTSVLSDLN